jgi:hypothetical protein
MAPGFHILVYAKTDQASAYLFFIIIFFCFSSILAPQRRMPVICLTEVVEIWMLEYPGLYRKFETYIFPEMKLRGLIPNSQFMYP